MSNLGVSLKTAMELMTMISLYQVLWVVLLQREVTTSSKVAVLPTTYQALSAQAVEYSLACVQLPKDVSCVDTLFLLTTSWASGSIAINAFMSSFEKFPVFN